MNIISLLIPKANLDYVFDDHTIRQGLEKMRVHGYTAVPVLTRSGKYAGTVSEGDFLWNIIDDSDNSIRSREKNKISDIIREGFNPPVDVYISMEKLFQRATNQSFVPVTDDRGSFIGIVTRQTIIKTLIDKTKTAAPE